jgi:hypothetical protein
MQGWLIGLTNTRGSGRKPRARLDLIRTDLNVCLTFAAVAETAISMGHREHAKRTIARTEKGYSDMLMVFSHGDGDDIRSGKRTAIEIQTTS